MKIRRRFGRILALILSVSMLFDGSTINALAAAQSGVAEETGYTDVSASDVTGGDVESKGGEVSDGDAEASGNTDAADKQTTVLVLPGEEESASADAMNYNYAPGEYAVVFDLDNADTGTAPANRFIGWGDIYTLPSAEDTEGITKNGYKLDGWYISQIKDGNGNVVLKYPDEEKPESQKVTLNFDQDVRNLPNRAETTKTKETATGAVVTLTANWVEIP